MKTFSLSVFSLSFVIGAVSFLLRGNKLEGFCKRVLSWLLFASLLPFLPLLGEKIGDIPDFTLPQTPSALTEVTKEATETGLSAAIAEQYGVNRSDIRVVLIGFSSETMQADKVAVFLSGSAVLKDQIAIRYFVEEQDLGPCEVVYE